jgi:tetratricopeptide (TPR) repeat protein
VLVVQLIQQGLLASHGRIAIAYHRLEARFYEQEYERTGNKWNLPNASSHWRKADEPKSALQVTENLDFDQIKENKLKSALLTTRGGAFRDIDKLDDAQKCALKAIEYQPQSHHPYTLMGAICFERSQFSEGERWFNEAIKRGAESEEIDSELKQVVKNTKDENKRREVVEYLLKKNPQRYAWAKSYRKRQGGEDAQRKNS